MTATLPLPPALRAAPGSSADLRRHLGRLDGRRLTSLLLRCRDNDEQAFEEFYRLSSRVVAVLVAARRLPAAASDQVLVDVYVQVWRQAYTFDPDQDSVWQWTLSILNDLLSAPPAHRRPRTYPRSGVGAPGARLAPHKGAPIDGYR